MQTFTQSWSKFFLSCSVASAFSSLASPLVTQASGENIKTFFQESAEISNLNNTVSKTIDRLVQEGKLENAGETRTKLYATQELLLSGGQFLNNFSLIAAPKITILLDTSWELMPGQVICATESIHIQSASESCQFENKGGTLHAKNISIQLGEGGTLRNHGTIDAIESCKVFAGEINVQKTGKLINSL